MERRTESIPRGRVVALAALALLGPALGIATQVWAQALLLLGLGALLLISPPRRSPGAVWWLLAVAILVIAGTAFLPARWLAMPEWRRTLTTDFRVKLPETFSPQPWVSLHAACLLFAALVFTLYLATQAWGSRARRQAAKWYAGGVVILAAVALVTLGKTWRVPFWPAVLNSMNGFGIFPNRNQTANVFALAGIMATALAFDAFERRKKDAWFWVGGVAVLAFAVVQTFSRAGVLLFFGGIAAWVLLSFAQSATRKGGALTVAGFALLLTGFFVFGGGSLERVQTLSHDAPLDYRVRIQKDALHLAASAPWLGQGLGNFAPVFAMAREKSADQNHALHPESDWLWLAVEMGWPAVALVAAAFALWLRQCLPMSPGSDRALRSAAMVCGVAFALHSFGDVSGHRPGSAWPAIFLAGLALHPQRTLERRRWVAPVFRALGVLLTAIAGWWFMSIFSERLDRTAPTLATVARLAERVERQNLAKEHAAAVVTANDALRITPLEADLYYARGVAHVAEAFSVWGAGWDFATARFLEPHLAALCFAEGKTWIEAGQPALAFDAWLEALRRAGENGPAMYNHMLDWAGHRLGMHAALARLARSNPAYLLIFLSKADRLECELLIGQLVEAEPKLESLNSTQKRRLFSLWYQNGDRALLFTKLLANPEWQHDGWRWLATLYADRKDFENACEIAREATPVPALPKSEDTKPLADLDRLFRVRPDDIGVGLQLYRTQLSLGKTGDALATLRTLQALPNSPSYLTFIEAQFHEEVRNWEAAWNAWLRFGGRDWQ